MYKVTFKVGQLFILVPTYGLTGVSCVVVYMHLQVFTSMSVYDVVHCI